MEQLALVLLKVCYGLVSSPNFPDATAHKLKNLWGQDGLVGECLLCKPESMGPKLQRPSEHQVQRWCLHPIMGVQGGGERNSWIPELAGSLTGIASPTFRERPSQKYEQQ